MENKSYQVSVRYCFDGIYVVKAGTRSEAVQSVKKDCGMVMGGSIHTVLHDDMVDWDFPVHPEVIISSVRLSKRNSNKKQYGSKST
jgi:hypothetical protein